MKKILGYTISVLTLAPLPLALAVSPVEAFSFWFWVVTAPYIIAFVLLGVLLIFCSGSSPSGPVNKDSNNLEQIKKYEELNFIRYRSKL